MGNENFEAPLPISFLRSEIFSPYPLVLVPCHSSQLSFLSPAVCAEHFPHCLREPSSSPPPLPLAIFLLLLSQLLLLAKETIFPSWRSNLFSDYRSFSLTLLSLVLFSIFSVSALFLSPSNPVLITHFSSHLYPIFKTLPEFMLGI